MRFLQILNYKKFTLISIILFFYILFNLIDGERGLISYFEKQRVKEQLLQEKQKLTHELRKIENKNTLLTEKIDLDYLEILYRNKFLFGKPEEKIYNLN
tara:strand:- start:15175 stop:15471 length:297 start_codon:yes stop_codon:yes gene_type:complete